MSLEITAIYWPWLTELEQRGIRISYSRSPDPMTPLYQVIASKLTAMRNCSENIEWEHIHEAVINDLVAEYFPHSSGFDMGTKLDWANSTPERLIFTTSFHHMTEGTYDGWTEHCVTVRASLADSYILSISGRDRDGIKELIEQVFSDALDKMIPFPSPILEKEKERG